MIKLQNLYIPTKNIFKIFLKILLTLDHKGTITDLRGEILFDLFYCSFLHYASLGGIRLTKPWNLLNPQQSLMTT